MSWSDEPENEERWSEWDWIVDDVSSTIQSLVEDFGENSSHKVFGYSRQLMQAVISITSRGASPSIVLALLSTPATWRWQRGNPDDPRDR